MLLLTKLLEFSSMPRDWMVQTLSFDWDMNPMLVAIEGKPPQPPRDAPPDRLVAWLNSAPKAHHLVQWIDGKQSIVTFDHPTEGFVQRLDDGFLCCDSRGGAAFVCDSKGRRTGKALDLGDGIEDVQTTIGGNIWVSYFDEGVFGNGIGSAGLVCFDAKGRPQFQYNDYAEERDLPIIDDLYAMNVVNDSEVWICYYSDFPLVRLRGFECDEIFASPGPVNAIAIDGERLIAAAAYETLLFQGALRRDEFVREEVSLAGTELSQAICRYRARGRKLGILTASAAYIGELAQE